MSLPTSEKKSIVSFYERMVKQEGKMTFVTPEQLCCSYTAEPEELNFFLEKGSTELPSQPLLKDECSQPRYQEAEPGVLPRQSVRKCKSK